MTWLAAVSVYLAAGVWLSHTAIRSGVEPRSSSLRFAWMSCIFPAALVAIGLTCAFEAACRGARLAWLRMR